MMDGNEVDSNRQIEELYNNFWPEDPQEGCRISTVNSVKNYAYVPEPRFTELYDEATRIAHSESPVVTKKHRFKKLWKI